jgi:hypothetical protein
MELVNIIVQVLVCIIYVYVMVIYFIPYVYQGMDNQVKYSQYKKYVTDIIEGKMPLNSPGIEFDTQNQSKYPLYKKLHLSSNIKGGSQYSVSFWMNKDLIKLGENNKEFVVFLHGNKNSTMLNHFRLKKSYDSMKLAITENKESIKGATEAITNETDFVHSDIERNKYDIYTFEGLEKQKRIQASGDKNYMPVSSTEAAPETNKRVYSVNKPTIVQKAPLIYIRYFSKKEIEEESKDHNTDVSEFTEEGNYMVIEYNSLKNFNNRIFLPEKGKILQNFQVDSWVLFTLVFEPYYDYTKFTSGYTVSLYLNKTAVYMKTVNDDTVKSNNGNVYILPKLTGAMDMKHQFTGNKGFIADVRYANHALSSDEIIAMYNQGHRDYAFTTPTDIDKARLKEKYYRLSLDERTNHDWS